MYRSTEGRTENDRKIQPAISTNDQGSHSRQDLKWRETKALNNTKLISIIQ